MRITFVADYASPIARNWIDAVVEAGHEVHVIATYPYEGETRGLASLENVSLFFSGLARRSGFRALFAGGSRNADAGAALPPKLSRVRRAMSSAGQELRWLAASSAIPVQAYAMRRAIDRTRPEIVHAMRIPFEGLVAAEALRGSDLPLLISVWGNDFTLHARDRTLVRLFTHRAVARADALHTDCFRDVRLAEDAGFSTTKPRTVLPGAGGVRLDVFHPRSELASLREKWDIPIDARVIINARGFRPYVMNDAFFAALPEVWGEHRNAVVLCVGMANNPMAAELVGRHGLESCVRLLPVVSQDELAGLFTLADVAVSPATHDGTPNTLLEAMACGAFPVAGDIESLREWIEDGVNGLLCDPTSPDALAAVMMRALSDEGLRSRARRRNMDMILARAEHGQVMSSALAFYHDVHAMRNRGAVRPPRAASPSAA